MSPVTMILVVYFLIHEANYLNHEANYLNHEDNYLNHEAISA